MGENYKNILLTLIALMLAAIVASIYVPAIREFTSASPPPTKQDFDNLRTIADRSERNSARQALRSRIPVFSIDGGSISVNGGSISVSGAVEVENTVTVETVVEKERREAQRRRSLDAWLKSRFEENQSGQGN